jgi:hypothetical protein
MTDLENKVSIMTLVCLRVAAMGNLVLFATIPDNPGPHWWLNWYLTILFVETGLVFLLEQYNRVISERRARAELRQWPVSTLMLRGPYIPWIYHFHILNILLAIVWFCPWTYTNYFCGLAYSLLVLVEL